MSQAGNINTETSQVVDGPRMKFCVFGVFAKVDHTPGLSNITFLWHLKICSLKSGGRAAQRVLSHCTLPVQSGSGFGTCGRWCVT